MRLPTSTLAFLFSLGACLNQRVTSCADGRLCPEGTACDDAHQGCVLPEQLERCNDEPDGTPCGYRGVRDGACYDGVCLPAGCGNGRLDENEVCDDGNRAHNDGCAADCRSDERCGNAILDLRAGESCDPPGTRFCRADCVSVTCGDGTVDREALELCDLGAPNSSAPDASCRPNCQPRRCGDGVQDSGEVCDDGNNLPGDGCSSDCKSTEVCGNGVVDVTAHESCEPPGTELCRADCVSTRCGDGVLDVNAFEQCDEGLGNSLEPDAACRPNCQPQRCGDGVTDSGEVCDDGNQRNGDGCSFDCKSDETCGNGRRDPDEECDDENFLNHDGCSSLCFAEHPVEERLLRGSGGDASTYDAARGRIVSNSSEYAEQWASLEYRPRAVLPPVRLHESIAWDSRRRLTVMFGGRAAGYTLLNQTWQWNGATWRRAYPDISPPARAKPALINDSARGRIVMFGGVTDDAPFADTWEWDGVSWLQFLPAHAPLAGAWSCAFDPKRGQAAIVDGRSLWWWNGDDWLEDPAPLPMQTLPGEELVLGYDLHRGRMVLFFPRTRSANEASSFWELASTGWRSLPVSAPATDLWTGSRLFFSGIENRFTLQNGSRLWRLAGDTWQVIQDAGSWPPEEAGALAYDPLHGTILMTGRGKTWRWGGVSWVELLDANTPPVYAGHDLAYDVDAREFVMVGGFERDASGSDTLLPGTFVFDGTRWTRRQPSQAPEPRAGPSLTYDLRRRRILLFGGSTATDQANRETWSWSGGQWTMLDSGPALSGRGYHASTYDPLHEETLMVGGLLAVQPPPLADLWTFGDGWSRQRAVGTSSRREHAVTYDANRRSFFVLGGFPVDGWELHIHPDGSYGDWQGIGDTSLNYSGSGRIAAYDALHARTVVHVSRYDGVFSYSSLAQPDEACRYGFDTDGDSLIGCDDPDCWPFCTPLCPPSAPCDLTYPHCGDRECNEALEGCRMCPDDCGTCPALCGDFFCDAPETEATCPGDCTLH